MFNIGLIVILLGLLLKLFWSPGGLVLTLCGFGVWLVAAGRFVWDRFHGVPLPPPTVRRAPSAGNTTVAVEEDRHVNLDDLEVPESIRCMVRKDMQPGDTLWRCVRYSSPRQQLVLEWWLLSAEGDLIEGYWLEP